jgi:hypothetical protein
MHFDTKNYLKSTRKHTIKHALTEEESIIGILKDENGPLKIDGARLIINELSFASSRPIGLWSSLGFGLILKALFPDNSLLGVLATTPRILYTYRCDFLRNFIMLKIAASGLILIII